MPSFPLIGDSFPVVFDSQASSADVTHSTTTATNSDAYQQGGNWDPSLAPLKRLEPSSCIMSAYEARAFGELPNERYSLPETVALGASTIHRYREGHMNVTVSAFVPLSSPALSGAQLDLNRKRFDEIIPHRAVLSDFGRRAFIGIDKRPGTPLDRRLRRLVACIPRGPNGYQLDTVLEWLRTHVHTVLAPRPEPSTDADRATCPWDQELQLPHSADRAFRAANQLWVDDPPFICGVEIPVVPFEKFLDEGRGACLQKALLATLILERLGFQCRLVNGAVHQALATASGHAWVGLADGRILCPTWQIVQVPERPVDFPGELRIGWSLLFPSSRSPYLACYE